MLDADGLIGEQYGLLLPVLVKSERERICTSGGKDEDFSGLGVRMFFCSCFGVEAHVIQDCVQGFPNFRTDGKNILLELKLY